MTDCSGPYRDDSDGALYCPADFRNAPDYGESWQEFCEKCQSYRAWYDELKSDARRDEGWC
jgi:hypothetical protein